MSDHHTKMLNEALAMVEPDANGWVRSTRDLIEAGQLDGAEPCECGECTVEECDDCCSPQVAAVREVIDRHEIWKQDGADGYNAAADHLANETVRRPVEHEPGGKIEITGDYFSYTPPPKPTEEMSPVEAEDAAMREVEADIAAMKDRVATVRKMVDAGIQIQGAWPEANRVAEGGFKACLEYIAWLESALALGRASYCREPEWWQRIETAPKDGTRFLAAEPEDGWIIGVCLWCKTPHAPIYGFHFTDGDPEDWDIAHPTKWQPLPKPPVLP